MRIASLCTLSVLAVFDVAALAQTATVNGVVTDSSQAVMPGATVTITNLETALRRDTRTNDTGNYTFTLLPVGRYRVSAAASGFNTDRKSTRLNSSHGYISY